MNANLLNAILSMDAYNRGYLPGIRLHEPNQTEGQKLGSLTISKQTDVDDDTAGVQAGFYGVSYYYDDNNNNVHDTDEQTFISFRGTDDEGNIDLGVSLADMATALIRPNIPETLVLLAKIANNADINITPDCTPSAQVGQVAHYC